MTAIPCFIPWLFWGDLVIPWILTTSLSVLSGIFLEDLQTPFAAECENITGASLTAIPCFIPWKSLVIPPIALGCIIMYISGEIADGICQRVRKYHRSSTDSNSLFHSLVIPYYLVIPCLLTTSLKMLSGIFLEELQTAFAEEWENITGASLTARVSRAV